MGNQLTVLLHCLQLTDITLPTLSENHNQKKYITGIDKNLYQNDPWEKQALSFNKASESDCSHMLTLALFGPSGFTTRFTYSAIYRGSPWVNRESLDTASLLSRTSELGNLKCDRHT